jgi:hypothetical protein
MFITNVQNNDIDDGGSYIHRQFLNKFFKNTLFKKLEPPVTWNSILPADCYYSNFSWQIDSMNVIGKESLGTFTDMGLKEMKDVPTIEFSETTERIDLYSKESRLVASGAEIDKYQAWTSEAGLQETSYITQLIDSAVDRYNYFQNQFFFRGDGKNTHGLLNSPAMMNLTITTTDILEMITEAISMIRVNTKGVIKPGTLAISPQIYALLSRYTVGSDLNNLQKIKNIIADTTAGGEPQYLKIIVLDVLSEPDVSNNLYFLDSNRSQFLYYYKPLIVEPFRESGARSYIAATMFKYSDPYVYTKGAISKCTIVIDDSQQNSAEKLKNAEPAKNNASQQNSTEGLKNAESAKN